MNDGGATWIKIITRIFEDSKIVALPNAASDLDVVAVFRLDFVSLSPPDRTCRREVIKSTSLSSSRP
jgi:hypothetical protein